MRGRLRVKQALELAALVLIDAIFRDVAAQALAGPVKDFDFTALIVAGENLDRRAVVDLAGNHARAHAAQQAGGSALTLHRFQVLE